MKYSIIPFDLKGSVKPFDHHGRIQEIDLDLPEGAIPIGYDVIIKDKDEGTQHIDWGFYPLVKTSESWQREWMDDAHTEFVCVIDGKLKHYQVITRIYCMVPKASGTWRVDNSKLIEDIKQDLNAAVDSKDHHEVIQLIESVKEKLDFLNIELKEVGENTNLKPVGAIPIHLNPKAYIGTNIKEGTTDVSISIQHTEGVVSGDIKHLVVMWEDGQHHEVRFPIYLLEAQACQK